MTESVFSGYNEAAFRKVSVGKPIHLAFRFSRLEKNSHLFLGPLWQEPEPNKLYAQFRSAIMPWSAKAIIHNAAAGYYIVDTSEAQNDGCFDGEKCVFTSRPMHPVKKIVRDMECPPKLCAFAKHTIPSSRPDSTLVTHGTKWAKRNWWLFKAIVAGAARKKVFQRADITARARIEQALYAVPMRHHAVEWYA